MSLEARDITYILMRLPLKHRETCHIVRAIIITRKLLSADIYLSYIRLITGYNSRRHISHDAI